jgi:hypothetical protein
VLPLIAGLFTALPVRAAEFGTVRELSLSPSVQYHTWEEFSTRGARFLKETGAVYGLGGAVDLDVVRTESAGALSLRGKAELFGGDVDYDGQTIGSSTTPPVPVKTSVVYFGAREEVDLGWKIGSRVSVTPFAGLGYRWWLRSLQGAGGYDEHWSSIYARAGSRIVVPLRPGWQLFAEAGAKYPLETTNTVNFVDAGNVDFKPQPLWSPFAEAGFRHHSLRLSLSYEGSRWADSPGSANGFYQPHSVSEIYAISVGYCFR